MSMEGSKNSVGSGSTAPFTSLIWPGMMKTKTTLRVNVRRPKDRQRFQKILTLLRMGFFLIKF